MILMTDGTKEQRDACRKLALKTGCDPRTAMSWMLGRNVKAAVAYGLERAFEDLGLDAGFRNEVAP